MSTSAFCATTMSTSRLGLSGGWPSAALRQQQQHSLAVRVAMGGGLLSGSVVGVEDRRGRAAAAPGPGNEALTICAHRRMVHAGPVPGEVQPWTPAAGPEASRQECTDAARPRRSTRNPPGRRSGRRGRDVLNTVSQNGVTVEAPRSGSCSTAGCRRMSGRVPSLARRHVRIAGFAAVGAELGEVPWIAISLDGLEYVSRRKGGLGHHHHPWRGTTGMRTPTIAASPALHEPAARTTTPPADPRRRRPRRRSPGNRPVTSVPGQRPRRRPRSSRVPERQPEGLIIAYSAKSAANRMERGLCASPPAPS